LKVRICVVGGVGGVDVGVVWVVFEFECSSRYLDGSFTLEVRISLDGSFRLKLKICVFERFF
jgi:hypothetical protein